VADRQNGVGRRQRGGRIIQEEKFLGATVEVSVRLSKSQTVSQKIGGLVVIDAVTGKRVTSLHHEDVGHSENKGSGHKEG